MMQANPESTQPQPVPEAAPPASGAAAFAAFPPLPLRPRGILELLDVSIKVYKQYLPVLMGWSVLIVAGSMVGSIVGRRVPLGGLLPSLLLTQLMTGVVACCLAAGVRGQRVEFSQCWRFTKPRFWPMVGLYVLAALITIMVMIAFGIVCALVGGLGFLLFRNAQESTQLGLMIIGGFMALTAGTLLGTIVAAWANLVPVVVCMEPDKMNSRALGRAYELIRGQWVRVCTLSLMLGLGILVLYAILGVAAMLLIGLPQLQAMLSGQTVDTGVWAAATGIFLLNGILFIIYKPIFSLVINLFYLDTRVRNEALDLEWSAHVTAPPLEAPTPTPPLEAPTPTPSALSVQLPTGFAAAHPLSNPTPYTDAYTPPPAGSTTPLADGTMPSAVVTPPEHDVPGGAFSTPAPFAATALAMQAPPNQIPAVQTGAVAPFPGALGFTPSAVEPSLAGETAVPASGAELVGAAPQGQTITCPQCGVTAPAAYIFCMKCGTKLRAGSTSPRW